MAVWDMPVFHFFQKNARFENACFFKKSKKMPVLYKKSKKNARFDIARIPGLILPVFSQKLRKCQFMFIKKTLG